MTLENDFRAMLQERAATMNAAHVQTPAERAARTNQAGGDALGALLAAAGEQNNPTEPAPASADFDPAVAAALGINL